MDSDLLLDFFSKCTILQLAINILQGKKPRIKKNPRDLIISEKVYLRRIICKQHGIYKMISGIKFLF